VHDLDGSIGTDLEQRDERGLVRLHVQILTDRTSDDHLQWLDRVGLRRGCRGRSGRGARRLRNDRSRNATLWIPNDDDGARGAGSDDDRGGGEDVTSVHDDLGERVERPFH
jgi:hypothetical protein